MTSKNNLYRSIEFEDNLLNQYQQIEDFCSRQKQKTSGDSFCNSYSKKSSTKLKRNFNKNNPNQELQDLLDSQTIIYGNIENLSCQKKRLFTQLSFLSKDYTNDHSNDQGYQQFMHKIHFQRSRNRQLNQQLAIQKQKLVQKYLKDLLQQFKQLSEENKELRQVYKKEANGGYKPKLKKNTSMKIQDNEKNSTVILQPENATPRNLKTGRRSIAGGSISGGQIFRNKNIQMRQRPFFGVGNENFDQPKKLEIFKPTNKLIGCQSSINIHAGQSLVPSPKKHKRRESQLTQRKDYPQRQNKQNDFLIFDDNSQLDNLQTGRMSQPGKMTKKHYPRQINQNDLFKNSSQLMKFTQKNCNSNVPYNSTNIDINSTKNIFLQYLQQLLFQQKVSYNELTQDITENVEEQQKTINIPSYNNIKYIEKLQQQIKAKNLKLRQLQQVVNVFKSQIEQIMGTDIKMINQLMVELLQVKGKYLQMQQKVNGLCNLKKQVQKKQKLKEHIAENIKKNAQKIKKQQEKKQQQVQEVQQSLFAIPQSIKTLFQLLNIHIPKNCKPIDYLKQIQNLPKNKQLFQAFDSKKRNVANIKVKQIIDSLREGRKKFNEVIKIYEGRIDKLQQKLQRYKMGNNISIKTGNEKQVKHIEHSKLVKEFK